MKIKTLYKALALFFLLLEGTPALKAQPGALDTTFLSSYGRFAKPDNTHQIHQVVEHDGKALCIRTSRPMVFMFNEDGSLDTGFHFQLPDNFISVSTLSNGGLYKVIPYPDYFRLYYILEDTSYVGDYSYKGKLMRRIATLPLVNGYPYYQGDYPYYLPVIDTANIYAQTVIDSLSSKYLINYKYNIATNTYTRLQTSGYWAGDQGFAFGISNGYPARWNNYFEKFDTAFYENIKAALGTGNYFRNLIPEDSALLLFGKIYINGDTTPYELLRINALGNIDTGFRIFKYFGYAGSSEVIKFNDRYILRQLITDRPGDSIFNHPNLLFDVLKENGDFDTAYYSSVRNYQLTEPAQGAQYVFLGIFPGKKRLYTTTFYTAYERFVSNKAFYHLMVLDSNLNIDDDFTSFFGSRTGIRKASRYNENTLLLFENGYNHYLDRRVSFLLMVDSNGRIVKPFENLIHNFPVDAGTFWDYILDKDSNIYVIQTLHPGLYPYSKIIKLSKEGFIDSSFDIGPLKTKGVSNGVLFTVEYWQNKLVIHGEFDSVQGMPRKNLAFLNMDGSLSSFYPLANAREGAYYGKAIVADDSVLLTLTQNKKLVRIFSDGTVDSTVKDIDFSGHPINQLFKWKNKYVVTGKALPENHYIIILNKDLSLFDIPLPKIDNSAFHSAFIPDNDDAFLYFIFNDYLTNRYTIQCMDDEYNVYKDMSLRIPNFNGASTLNAVHYQGKTILTTFITGNVDQNMNGNNLSKYHNNIFRINTPVKKTSTLVNEVKSDNSTLLIYPNPAGDESVTVALPGNTISRISIFDIQGKLVLRSDTPFFSSASLSNGFYIIKAETNTSATGHGKFLKQ